MTVRYASRCELVAPVLLPLFRCCYYHSLFLIPRDRHEKSYRPHVRGVIRPFQTLSPSIFLVRKNPSGCSRPSQPLHNLSKKYATDQVLVFVHSALCRPILWSLSAFSWVTIVFTATTNHAPCNPTTPNSKLHAVLVVSKPCPQIRRHHSS